MSNAEYNQSSLDAETHRLLIQSTAGIVTALIDNGECKDVGKLIRDIYEEFASLAAPSAPKAATKMKLVKPSIAIEDSIKPDYIICLEDGKKLKMLKRYLKTNFNLTPEQYRARWKLPQDYPMVAPEYAKKRSSIARKSGLGKKKASAVPAPRGGRKKARA